MTVSSLFLLYGLLYWPVEEDELLGIQANNVRPISVSSRRTSSIVRSTVFAVTQPIRLASADFLQLPSSLCPSGSRRLSRWAGRVPWPSGCDDDADAEVPAASRVSRTSSLSPLTNSMFAYT